MSTNKQHTWRALIAVGLLAGSSLAVRADDVVTFQVDMSRYTNSGGGQAADLVAVHGSFDGWGAGLTLINNGANVYSNTTTVTGTNGTQFQYKFTYNTCAGTTWEDNNPPPGPGQPPDAGNNRVLQLVGGTQVLPVVPFYAPSVTTPISLISGIVTYRVDMTEQIQITNFFPGLSTIRVTGAPAALTSWGLGVDMTNNPSLTGDASNIYSAVVSVCGTYGTLGGEYKFRADNGWEDLAIGGNRNFTFTGGNQVLQAYYYNDQPIGPVTNGNITFRVDMTPQVITGGFTNGVSAVTLSGRINGWSAGTAMTNDLTAIGTATNIYSCTIPLPSDLTSTVGDWSRYKFRADGGWEAAAIYGVGQNSDRLFFITGGDQVLPLVTYNDASLCDVLLQPTLVTFRLHITNGTPDNFGVPFDKGNDTIWINGEFLGWPGWTTNTLPQMTNNPLGSDYYEFQYEFTGGKSRRLQYKFGIDGTNHVSGLDNENPTYFDHVKYVRGTGSTFVLPAAEFGTNFLSQLVEPRFGDLAAGAPASGKIPLTWLGCPCVTLQTRSSLSSGSWVDIPATDGTSATNWPNSANQQYFRLQRRPFP